MRRSQLSTLKKILWVAYLSIALVVIQGMRLHVHTYNHDPATSNHAHLDQVHSVYDSFDSATNEHPGEVAEIDLAQQGFLKNLSFGSLVIALFVAVIVILSPRLLTRVPWRDARRAPLASLPFNLRPPLRAPPL